MPYRGKEQLYHDYGNFNVEISVPAIIRYGHCGFAKYKRFFGLI